MLASLRGLVFLFAGARGFHRDSLIVTGINTRQYFNGISFDVTGLLYIMLYVRDQQQNIFMGLISSIIRRVYINGPLAS